MPTLILRLYESVTGQPDRRLHARQLRNRHKLLSLGRIFFEQRTYGFNGIFAIGAEAGMSTIVKQHDLSLTASIDPFCYAVDDSLMRCRVPVKGCDRPHDCLQAQGARGSQNVGPSSAERRPKQRGGLADGVFQSFLAIFQFPA